MATAQVRAHFQELMRGFDTAMLITRSPEGKLHARPMVLAEITATGEIWFVTDVNSPKVDELFADSDVAVVMQSSDKYLTVNGRAEIERNPAKIQELWRESWRVWFDERSNPDLVLIRVTGLSAEYWDNSSLRAAKVAFRVAQAYLAGDQDPNRDETEGHARLTLP